MPTEPLSPNMERLELAGQNANEALISVPRDLLYPKYTPAPRTKTLREILLDNWFFGFWMRYEAQEKREKRYAKKIRN